MGSRKRNATHLCKPSRDSELPRHPLSASDPINHAGKTRHVQANLGSAQAYSELSSRPVFSGASFLLLPELVAGLTIAWVLLLLLSVVLIYLYRPLHRLLLDIDCPIPSSPLSLPPCLLPGTRLFRHRKAAMAAPPTSQAIKSLYHNMLRSSQGFSSYNFREYFMRRTKDTFREIQVRFGHSFLLCF